MHFGVIFPQVEFPPDPAAVRDYAQTVEGLGFSHIVAYDHVLGANPARPGGWKGPYTHESSFLEPFVLFRIRRFKPDFVLVEGYDLSRHGIDARVLHLPGHSKGSIGILTAGGDLFCGDLLMNVIRPELHFLIDDLAECGRSIQKLAGLNVKTVYPGHGRPFRMAEFSKISRPIS